jgi:ketosteroid isomerase-like protein
MTIDLHQIARDFFAGLSTGQLPDALVSDDLTVWTTTTGSGEPAGKAKYAGGIKMLGALFDGGLAYTVDALIAEGDRVVAEAHSDGTLSNGEPFHNRYVFILTIKDGRITAIAEHFNPEPVMTKIRPLLAAAMSKTAG